MNNAGSTTVGMTVDEFMLLPDDGKERWLVAGRLFPREPVSSIQTVMTSGTLTTFCYILHRWKTDNPSAGGHLLARGAGFLLRRDPDTLLGSDLAYVSNAVIARSPIEQVYLDGSPTLIVEILSPPDLYGEIIQKVTCYRDAGAVVWVVDPNLQTICVCHPDGQTESYAVGDELVADPYLPGFRVAVADLFED